MTLAGKQVLPVLNKIDLPQLLTVEDLTKRIPTSPPVLISTKTGEGKQSLEAQLQEIILGAAPSKEARSNAMVSNVRHSVALTKTKQSLKNVLGGLHSFLPLDLVAVDLRTALDHIGEITGHVTSEDILDQIFREFCVGK
jgi:tRNA modification GTPase